MQIHIQFPLSFEFNQYFIKFVAYHYVSNRFRTFMLDNEFERMEAGWLMDQSSRTGTLKADGNYDTDPSLSPRHSPSQGATIWDYIEKHQKRLTVFYNFNYTPLEQETVLRPYSNISSLKIWDYFLGEDLCRGPSYDFEVIAAEKQLEYDQELVDGTVNTSMRKIVNACYDDVAQVQPDACTHLLQVSYMVK